jgi:hypothetical protein
VQKLGEGTTGQHHMQSWYQDKLKGQELVLLSENGFTRDGLSLRYVDHFILVMVIVVIVVVERTPNVSTMSV